MPKRLNVLISSTQQWNPGDEFIRFGIQYLLTDILGGEINWILWNRNPDLFIDRWDNARMRLDFLTNSVKEPSLDIIDLVVIAGTPEWYGEPVSKIYADLAKYPDVPLLILGVGRSAPTIQFQEYEIDLFKRENTFISTRGIGLSELINQRIEQNKAVPLPCPALFSDGIDALDFDKSKKTGFILQNASVINQSISEKTLTDSLRLLDQLRNANIETDIICFYIDEFMRFSRIREFESIVYYCDSKNYLRELSKYSLILSTRLHGAIASLSCYTPSILLSNNNFRLSTTQSLFQGVLPIHKPEEITVEKIHEQLECRDQQINNIQLFKELTYKNYKDLLVPFVSKYVKA